MKHLCIGIIFICHMASAQVIQPPMVSAINTGGHANMAIGNTTRSFQYANFSTQDWVRAVVWTGTFPDAGFHFERYISGAQTSGNVVLNIGAPPQQVINPDIAIGNGGNSILVVYQTMGRIEWQAFGWNGSTYSQTGSGQLSTPIPNYVYGNPRVDINHATNEVVATYFSYGNSPTNEGFAIKGDINGNWITPTGSAPFNAYRLTNASSFLPNSGGNIKGPLSVSVYHNSTSGTFVHFATNYINNNGNTELWHLSMEISNLTNQSSTIFLDEDQLYVAPSSRIKIAWPSIDTWDNSTTAIPGHNYRDFWAIAVPVLDLANGGSDILTYQGINSGFTTGPVNHTSSKLGLCDNNEVDIAYGDDFLKVVWRHTDCNNDPLLSDQDVLGTNMHFIGGTPASHFRVNNGFTNNQGAPSIAGSKYAETIVSWRDGNTQEVFFKIVGGGNYRVMGSGDAVSKQSLNGINQSALSDDEQDLSISKMNISPNPASGHLNISGISTSNAKYSIFNSNGAEVISGELELNENSAMIDVSSLKSGYYFLKLDNGFSAPVLIQ